VRYCCELIRFIHGVHAGSNPAGGANPPGCFSHYICRTALRPKQVETGVYHHRQQYSQKSPRSVHLREARHRKVRLNVNTSVFTCLDSRLIGQRRTFNPPAQMTTRQSILLLSERIICPAPTSFTVVPRRVCTPRSFGILTAWDRDSGEKPCNTEWHPAITGRPPLSTTGFRTLLLHPRSR
jgi:hypothetical protein